MFVAEEIFEPQISGFYGHDPLSMNISIGIFTGFQFLTFPKQYIYQKGSDQMTVQYRHARSTMTVQYRHARSTVTVLYCHTRNTMMLLYHDGTLSSLMQYHGGTLQGCTKYFLSGIQRFPRRICLMKCGIVIIKKCDKKVDTKWNTLHKT